jgi:hypothetical protein
MRREGGREIQIHGPCCISVTAPERLVRPDTPALLREAGANVFAIDEALSAAGEATPEAQGEPAGRPDQARG